jgi:hypothetical protein
MWKSKREQFVFYDKKDGLYKHSFVPRPFILSDFGLPQPDGSPPAEVTRKGPWG